jgi:hypothetical protein
MDKGIFMKTYKLLSADGSTTISETPGTLGGNSKAGIYGRLDCTAANSALSKGYAQHRVFFANEQAAIQAGYRPWRVPGSGLAFCYSFTSWKYARPDPVTLMPHEK